MDDCANYCASRSVNIDIFFDGNPPFEQQTGSDDVSVYFSGKGRDADTLIVEKSIAKSTTVVTNDGAVKRLTGSGGCKHLSPKAFCELISIPVLTGRIRKGKQRKQQGLTSQEVSWWKREMEKELKKKR